MVEKEVEKTIEALLEERRTFEPPTEFAARANARDPVVYDDAASNPDAWWASQAEQLDWFEKWETVFDWDPPHHE